MGSLPIPESLKRRATGALIILGALGWLAAAWYGRCTHAAMSCCTSGICAEHGHHADHRPRPSSMTSELTALWSHVYNPSRLKMLAADVTLTGTIVDATHGKRKSGVRREADGDCHGWIRLDLGQEQFLNAGNMSDEEGNLVYEVVCLFPVRQADAVAACKGYKNAVKLAPVGSHVRMTGSWVQDSNHARWNEIHPVSSIEVIP